MTIRVKERALLSVEGRPLTIDNVCDVATCRLELRFAEDGPAARRMQQSVAFVRRAVDEQRTIYGVTTGFGGMAGVPVAAELAAESQNNLLAFLAAGAGDVLEQRHVRAAMLLRANVLARGCSGVRPEIVRRLIAFLSADAVPRVRELGSIGASGDLVPLSTLARAITGKLGFVDVHLGDHIVDGETALSELGMEPLSLLPKEGLAIVNGTSFSSAIAANCVYEARTLMALSLAIQAMMLQALQVQLEPFDDFVHQQKPHPGQLWTARMMRKLLRQTNAKANGKPAVVQDRYSLRCLPQYFGPIVEGMTRAIRSVETEMNAVSDNPMVDPTSGRFLQSGNFLGQYIGIAMDDLRRYLGLMAKHLDVQIATLTAPEFSQGLSPSLRGNEDLPFNMGLKGLQITGNSIMPMLTHFGNPIVEHFPTHAEQFNQNVNGLSWGSANLAWRSVRLFQHYVSVALVFAVQALDLRTKSCFSHYDGRALLCPETAAVYEAVCRLVDVEPRAERPFLFNDRDQWLESQLASIYADLDARGGLFAAVQPILDGFQELDG